MLDAPILSGRAILHAIPVPAIVMSTDLQIIDVNASFEAAVARRRATLLDRPLFAEFPPRPDTPNLEATIRASVARAVALRQTDALEPGRHDIVMPDGGFETRYWRLSHSPVIENGEVTCILQLVEDVTAEVTKQLLLEARERTAAEGAALSFWDLNLVTGQLIRSAGVDAMHGFAPGEVGEDVEPFLERVHPEDRERVRMEVFSAAERGPGPTVLEHRLLLPDGSIRWISARGEILPGPVNGEPHLVGMVIDITEFRRNEVRLEAALTNQTMLLDEVNHRVKNSLQMVASLLSLESGRASPETREKLALGQHPGQCDRHHPCQPLPGRGRDQRGGRSAVARSLRPCRGLVRLRCPGHFARPRRDADPAVPEQGHQPVDHRQRTDRQRAEACVP